MMLGVLAAAIRRTVAGGTETDPYWDSVVALLHFEGDLVDQKGNTWSATDISYGDPKFGSSAVVLGQSASSHIDGTLPLDTLGDFTVELWAYRRVQARGCLYSTLPSARVSGFYFDIGPDYNLRFVYYNDDYYIISTPDTIPLSKWLHLAVTKSGQTLRLFVDGLLKTSHTLTIAILPGSGTAAIGYDMTSTTRQFQGSIDELRITEGVARYTADFTPPTKAFPDS